MGYKLCIAEKPSVAQDIAKVIGATEKQNGFYMGNGYIVTWAVGHLVGLAEPEEYGYVSQAVMYDKENAELAEESRQKALAELPLLPQEFKLIVLPKTKIQFNIVKKLMHRDDVDYIIDCGDMGAEGHILQWFIRVKAGCTKPVKRFCATSMTKEAIKSAMENLRDIKDFEKIIEGEFCKKKADWIMGMSMSRCESLLYNAKIDNGRVQSPTLYFVVKRFIDVQKFKPTKYFTIETEFLENFKVFWTKDINNKIPSNLKDNEGRLLNRVLAAKIAENTKNLKQGVITALQTKQKTTNRPQLYDITELERDGNRIYGYTADEVLAVAQELYEKKKILSYPRTDSRYITTDLQEYMRERIEMISDISRYNKAANIVLQQGLNIDGIIVNDEKVTDHHAIIVTENLKNFDINTLSEKEKNIFDLVATRMIVSFSEKYVYNETVVTVSFKNGFIFYASGKMPLNKGWKAVQSSLMNNVEETNTENREQQFQNISEGQIVNIKDIQVIPKETTAPKLHTQATLLTAMENAGASIKGGEILKGKGIGTQATRAAIIKELYNKKYVRDLQKGKTKYIVPTKQGINVIRVLPPELYSPAITAEWETKIAKIVSGEMTADEFMQSFQRFITDEIIKAKSNVITNIDFSPEKITLCKCPFCQKDVIQIEYISKKETDKGEKKVAYRCETDNCVFLATDNPLWLKIVGKKITALQAQKLISNKYLNKQCTSQKGKKYQGHFLLKLDKERGNIVLSFELGKYKK